MTSKFSGGVMIFMMAILLFSPACSPTGEAIVPTVPLPTNTPSGAGLDTPLRFDGGQIQVIAASLMENTDEAGEFPFLLPPNYGPKSAGDVILALIAEPIGGDSYALANKWKDLDVKMLDENYRESTPGIQGASEKNGKWYVMWIFAVSGASKEFTLYLTPEIKIDISKLLNK